MRTALQWSTLAAAALTPLLAHASVSVGTIDTSNKLARVCQDAACATYGQVNFAPTINASTPGATALSIADNGISGNAWGDQIGWINMHPAGAGVSVDANTGALSGYAYSSTGSWINFSPTGGGVTLVDNGSGSNLSGWAWVSGTYGGWLHFDCGTAGMCVKTDWRTTANRAVPATSSPAAGGGGIAGVTLATNSAIVPQLPADPATAVTPEVLPVQVSLPQPPSGATPPSIHVVDSRGRQPAGTDEAPHPPADHRGADVPVNAFDADSDGLPDSTPPQSMSADQGAYEGVVLPAPHIDPAHCLFCIVRRYDVAVAPTGIVRTGIPILKYGFVPRRYEVRIPLGQVLARGDKALAPDIDGTSSTLTVIALAVLRYGIVSLFL